MHQPRELDKLRERIYGPSLSTLEQEEGAVVARQMENQLMDRVQRLSHPSERISHPSARIPTVQTPIINMLIANSTTNNNVSPAISSQVRVSNNPDDRQMSISVQADPNSMLRGGGGPPAQGRPISLDSSYESFRLEQQRARQLERERLEDEDRMQHLFQQEEERQTNIRKTDESSSDDRALRGGNGMDGGEGRQLKRRGLTLQNTECFLCAYGDDFHDGIHQTHINTMKRILKNNYGKVRNIELSQFVHLYFVKWVYRPDLGMEMLEADMVLDHIEGLHSLSAMNFIVESIRDFKKVRFIARDSMCRSDGTFDYKAFSAFRQSHEALEKLYSKKPQGMLFNEEATAKDYNEKGAIVNLLPFSRDKEERQKRIEYKTAVSPKVIPTPTGTNTRPIARGVPSSLSSFEL